MAAQPHKWPSLLVIVRHGHSEQNALVDLLQPDLDRELQRLKTIRDADIALTATGIWQAQHWLLERVGAPTHQPDPVPVEVNATV